MTLMVAEGDVIAGKYRVEHTLGSGGMGVVVAATHLQLNQRVAIKILRIETAKNAEVVARFSREARTAAMIRSENVVRVLDVGALLDGSPYMVMEYLEGSDLAAILDAHGPIAIGLAVDYVLQACEALAEAHAANVIHRDLKPANLFLARRPDGAEVIKVLDFGISKTVTLESPASEMSLTQSAAFVGSPMYMSPEQMRAPRDVDNRTDIWSLGMILYELLAGRPAYVAATMPELCALVFTQDPPPLRTRRPDTPVRLEAAIMRCLRRQPGERFGSVVELVEALVPFGRAEAEAPARRSLRVVQNAGANRARSSSPPKGPEPPRVGGRIEGLTDTAWDLAEARGATGHQRRRWAWLALASLFLALLGVGLWRSWLRPSSPVALALSTEPPVFPSAPKAAPVSPISREDTPSGAPTPSAPPVEEPAALVVAAPDVSAPARSAPSPRSTSNKPRPPAPSLPGPTASGRVGAEPRNPLTIELK